jgi:uridine kinase/predicted TPR repeat methyltransferase
MGQWRYMAAAKDARKRVVEAGYDEMAERYLAWGGQVEGDPRGRFLEEFAALLPSEARVLELGCGAGVPSTQTLAEHFDVVGVDISEAQLKLARKNVPNAEFIHADVAEIAFPRASFDGVAAFYSLSHVPREEHAELFRRVAGWLKPGGAFLASLGVGGESDSTGEWLGVPMFFSSHSPEQNRALLEAAGFELRVDEIVSMREPEQEVSFQWVIGVKATGARLEVRKARDGTRRVETYRSLGETILASSRQPVRLVAVDGPGGAGKSTFARRLAGALGGAPIVHTDDFATGEPGLEWWPRLEREVIVPLRTSRVARYRRYDWPTRRLAEWHTVDPAPVVIIEGVSSARAAVADSLALSIWVDAPHDVRLRRGLERDGEAARAQWQQWMTEEETHFASDDTQERADVVVDGAPSLDHDEEAEFVRIG